MSRILAIDYGLKRTGIAVSDPLKIIAGALATVDTKEVLPFLENYLKKEKVETIVIGMPKTLNNEDSSVSEKICNFAEILKKKFLNMNIVSYDERFTSKIAQQTMIQGGMKKKDRQNKANTDKISATIILQSYMESIDNINSRLI